VNRDNLGHDANLVSLVASSSADYAKSLAGDDFVEPNFVSDLVFQIEKNHLASLWVISAFF
jgi:hypothetical protein